MSVLAVLEGSGRGLGSNAYSLARWPIDTLLLCLLFETLDRLILGMSAPDSKLLLGPVYTLERQRSNVGS